MKFFIDHHGCAKNQVDGEELAARLEAAGHSYVPSGDEADCIIINTCGFIESAKKESIDAALAIKHFWPDKKVLIAGCLAQRYPEALMTEMTEADGVLGNADLSLAPQALRNLEQGQRSSIVVEQPREIAFGYYPRRRLFDYPGSAHLKITEGCDNRCSYCAIPLIRGSLRSRSMEDVAAELESLVARGIFEVNLIGQDLGAYGRDSSGESDLVRLLERLERVEGDFRLRVLYIHPDHFPEGLLDIMSSSRKIFPYFDLPFQHASEKILRAMNRKGSARIYLELVERIRKTLPESMIRSTFLVGFPGESEEDFAALRGFQQEASLDWLGVFSYSREEGTPAYSMKARVPKKLAEARKASVEAAQGPITDRRLRRFIGKEIEVLAEEAVEGSALSLARGWMQAPDVDGLTLVKAKLEPGTRAMVRINAVNGVDFEAQPLAADEAGKP
ncbi:MAG: 30S ribosomal protein S12 methylthiotransferase RimO [Spirochaetia bacterium]|uniref:Ribosomal protein S12 methylthiotransferase RimO n=1 Tax=bioreactor metagenome TaxID=1076179 RepID=A0A644TJE9_9ZZZZ|nr:30S ribosomal protein S12 methylthiotransferase RimO [Spirochaetia bacterium]MCE1209733.1 30S ribosomal protein S12 methylthiotransferase RimO [Spirochaetia bacterium]MDD3820924.1 30S ribosomal protein S12 methylthiotransferase RimO [Spirochaetales bacterium]VBB40565.1 Ribosomal protein S12 methylthiotransferase RimO [uncultured Spirochaetota bacterium]